MEHETIKLYDRHTGKQVASESVDKLKRMSVNEVLAFFRLQRELGREWDINISKLVE